MLVGAELNAEPAKRTKEGAVEQKEDPPAPLTLIALTLHTVTSLKKIPSFCCPDRARKISEERRLIGMVRFRLEALS
jgi:hypothetical protein